MIWKRWVKTTIDLDKSNSKKYEFEVICDNIIYASKSKGHLPGFYYLVS